VSLREIDEEKKGGPGSWPNRMKEVNSNDKKSAVVEEKSSRSSSMAGGDQTGPLSSMLPTLPEKAAVHHDDFRGHRQGWGKGYSQGRRRM